MGDFDFLIEPSEPSETSVNPYQAPVETRSARRKSRGTKAIPWACEYSSANVWAKILVAAFCLLALTTFANILSHLMTINDLDPMIRQRQVDQARLQGIIVKLAVTGILGGLAYLLVVVLFIVWFRKSYKNLPALGAKKLDYGLGWTIGVWFIPIAGYFLPYQIAKDIWIYSNPQAVKASIKTVRNISKTPLLLWWLAFVLMVIIGQIARFTPDTQPGIQALETLRSATQMWIGYFVVQLIAAGLAVNVILTIARWQDQRYELVCKLPDEASGAARPEEPNPFENYS